MYQLVYRNGKLLDFVLVLIVSKVSNCFFLFWMLALAPRQVSVLLRPLYSAFNLGGRMILNKYATLFRDLPKTFQLREKANILTVASEVLHPLVLWLHHLPLFLWELCSTQKAPCSSLHTQVHSYLRGFTGGCSHQWMLFPQANPVLPSLCLNITVLIDLVVLPNSYCDLFFIILNNFLNYYTFHLFTMFVISSLSLDTRI